MASDPTLWIRSALETESLERDVVLYFFEAALRKGWEMNSSPEYRAYFSELKRAIVSRSVPQGVLVAAFREHFSHDGYLHVPYDQIQSVGEMLKHEFVGLPYTSSTVQGRAYSLKRIPALLEIEQVRCRLDEKAGHAILESTASYTLKSKESKESKDKTDLDEQQRNVLQFLLEPHVLQASSDALIPALDAKTDAKEADPFHAVDLFAVKKSVHPLPDPALGGANSALKLTPTKFPSFTGDDELHTRIQYNERHILFLRAQWELLYKYLDKGIHAVSEGAKAMSLEEIYQHLEIDELVNPMEMKEAEEPSAIQLLVKELDELLLDSEICLKALRGNELPIR